MPHPETPEFSRIQLRRGHRAEEFVEVGRDRFAERQEPDGGLVLLAVLAVECLEDLLRRFRRAEYESCCRSNGTIPAQTRNAIKIGVVAGQCGESVRLHQGDDQGVTA